MSPPSRRRFARQIRFLQARLSPEGYFGLHLTVGMLVILAAGWWFGDIAEDMSRDAGTRLLDERVASWFHEHATPAFTHVARFATFFGSIGFIGATSTCAALVLIVRKSWYKLLALALAVGGGSVRPSSTDCSRSSSQCRSVTGGCVRRLSGSLPSSWP
jgi:hypothetical protein